MKFLSFIRSSESHRNAAPPAALMEAMGKFIEKGFASGHLVETGGLKPSKDGVRIAIRGGELSVTDGPFTEMREVIGGWAILEAATKEEAVRFATEFVELHRKHWPGFDCDCEVRPMEEVVAPPRRGG